MTMICTQVLMHLPKTNPRCGKFYHKLNMRAVIKVELQNLDIQDPKKEKKKQAKALASYTGTKKGIKALAKALATYSETKKGREAQSEAVATYSKTKK